MARKKSHSKSRSGTRKRKTSRSRSSSKNKSNKVLEYLGDQQMELTPFVVPKSGTSQLTPGMYINDYTPLFSDKTRYIDKYSFSPFSPGVNKMDLFKYAKSDNQYMQRLLTLYQEGQNVLDNNTASVNNPLKIEDKHPNYFIPDEKQSGGGFNFLSNIIGTPQNYIGLAALPSTHSTFGLREVRLNRPKIPEYIKRRIKDVDQMFYTSSVKDKDTAKKILRNNYMVVSNEDSFDPDKEHLIVRNEV